MFSNLKALAFGVGHGLHRSNIQTYLDEFLFRFNRRRTRPAAFPPFFGIGVVTNPVTHKMPIT